MKILTQKSQSLGYSLIEVVTGMSIFAVLSLLSVNLFLSTTVGSTRNNTSRSVKQTGDHVLLLLENSLRGASHLVANSDSPPVVCANDMQSISYVNLVSGTTDVWAVQSNKIQLNGEDITGSELSVENNRLFIDCSVDPASGVTYVSVNFTLSRGAPTSDRQEEYVIQAFETSVTLRNR